MKRKHSVDARLEEIKRLAAMPDDKMDTSDIPELTEEQMRRGVRGRFYRPAEKKVIQVK